jgi:hypothetical protein
MIEQQLLMCHRRWLDAQIVAKGGSTGTDSALTDIGGFGIGIQLCMVQCQQYLGIVSRPGLWLEHLRVRIEQTDGNPIVTTLLDCNATQFVQQIGAIAQS